MVIFSRAQNKNFTTKTVHLYEKTFMVETHHVQSFERVGKAITPLFGTQQIGLSYNVPTCPCYCKYGWLISMTKKNKKNISDGNALGR